MSEPGKNRQYAGYVLHRIHSIIPSGERREREICNTSRQGRPEAEAKVKAKANETPVPALIGREVGYPHRIVPTGSGKTQGAIAMLQSVVHPSCNFPET